LGKTFFQLITFFGKDVNEIQRPHFWQSLDQFDSKGQGAQGFLKVLGRTHKTGALAGF
jgi:hypothetical protein